MSGSTDPNQVIIFDTTLRDGEQSPGASMNLEEKLRISELLEEMGVDVIEAGFPIASNGDFESVTEVAKLVKEAVVCGLARSARGDIERAAEAVKPAAQARIHTFISTSPLHMKFKLQMEPDDVYQAVIDSVSYARNFTDNVEWSPEDGSRTEHDFLCRCVEAAINAGATKVLSSVNSEEIINQVNQILPNGVDYAVESVGKPEIIPLCMSLLKRQGGKLVVI